ncbi:MAG: hypothetical protein ACE5R6_00525 [Candidatus Heimdallarchaeota archaeon]
MDKPMREMIELPAAVYRKIIRHSLIGLREPTENGTYRYDRWKEVIGTLLGKFKAGKIEIVDAIALGEGSHTHVLATNYEKIFETRDFEAQLLLDDADRVSICGWYHSHPGFSFFLSGTDKATQTTYQQQHDRAIALVVDPTAIFWANEPGIRGFRVQDRGIFGRREVSLKVSVIGLEREFREVLGELVEELGFDKPLAAVLPKPVVAAPPKFLPTPLQEIRVFFRVPEQVTVGKAFTVAVGVEGIETGVIQLEYELILPEELTIISQLWHKERAYAYHEVMTNGTVRVFRVRADRAASVDIIFDNIVVSNAREAVSMGRQTLTVIAI